MITIDEVRKRIEEQLRGKLPDGVSSIDETTKLEDLGLSSLQISDIVFGLEEDYDVEFDAAAAADAKTLGDVLVVANRALEEKDGGAPAAAPTPAPTPAAAPVPETGTPVAAESAQ